MWAHLGEARCPLDGGAIMRRSLDDCLGVLMAKPNGSKLTLIAPIMEAKASVVREELARLRQKGFQRVRIAGKVEELDNSMLELPRGEVVKLELVVDRIVLRADERSRLADSLELAWREGRGEALVMLEAPKTGAVELITLSHELACVVCGTHYEPMTVRHFNPNHPEGACPNCGGLGEELRFAPELVVPDPKKTVRGGAIKPWRLGSKVMIIYRNALLKDLAEQYPFDADLPWSDLPEDVRTFLLRGDPERMFQLRIKAGRSTAREQRSFMGVLADLEHTSRTTTSAGLRARLVSYQIHGECPMCHGERLSPRALAVLLGGQSIGAFLGSSLEQARQFIEGVESLVPQQGPLRDSWEALRARLKFLEQVGLGYLTLNRAFTTLSGGEAQRVRLATQLGLGLTGVIYVLDEPSIGLHSRDHGQLLKGILSLKDRGNTVVVVEHDAATMWAADWLVELGPGAGRLGGQVVFEGTTEAALHERRCRTGRYLSGELEITQDRGPRNPDDRWIEILGAREHNLRDIDVRVPVGLVTTVCGVSGSGKSTLINDILGCTAAFKLNRAKEIPGLHRAIHGLEYFKKVVRVDQSPMGRSARSNPATFVGLFDPLRKLFSQCPLARVRGYGPGRFSFNTRGGRCERCQGEGEIRLDMQFLDDAYIECPSCHGDRYNRETLEIRYRGLNIAELLRLTVDEARDLMRNQPKIIPMLQTLVEVGLGYLTLGQPAHTLSGGEAQRLKLAAELSKSTASGHNLYILDEPTTGLHWEDIQKLLDLLFKLRDAGHTVIMIEHHQDVIRLSDWVIELGPGGGQHGGWLVYAGEPQGIMAVQGSPTGEMLKAVQKRISEL
ncbi:MAG: excinuclease ABC subunit A [Verrucomicrobia bacterium 21-51-4]|nr:MAG: excinuclease ABC subunit A [Verrucomicrobia bacterium 21-51-4]